MSTPTIRQPGHRLLHEALEDARDRLNAEAAALGAHGVPVPRIAGKLLRPLVALGLVPPLRRAALDARFWSGALALQMVHEASLLHDDILDGAAERRGVGTVVAESGVSTALVLGDHYLTGAYRAASRVGSHRFVDRFIYAVERTVAGEIRQGKNAGTTLGEPEYRAIVEGKSGELFGAAAVLGALLLDLGDIDARVQFGRELGGLYQRVDDLLDYAPGAATGKPPLQDYRQRKWTWTMDLLGLDSFTVAEDEVVARLHERGLNGRSPLRRGVDALKSAGLELMQRGTELSPDDELVPAILSSWIDTAERAARSVPELQAVDV